MWKQASMIILIRSLSYLVTLSGARVTRAMYPSFVPSIFATIFKLKFPFGWKDSFSPVPFTVPMVPLLSVTVDMTHIQYAGLH